MTAGEKELTEKSTVKRDSKRMEDFQKFIAQ